jgi:hypothetical protein
MQSWHGHFVNKYIVCGELVEDPIFISKDEESKNETKAGLGS